MDPVIFLSYRHVDAHWVRALQVELQQQLPAGALVRDVHSFRAGDDLRHIITAGLERATTVLVILGPTWLQIDDRTGRERIHEGDDWVRFEVSLALAWNKVVIPVLVGEATMPERRRLPSDVAGIADKVAHRVRDSDWSADVSALVTLLDPQHATRERSTLDAGPQLLDAGPIAGGNITISGLNVAGRDLVAGVAEPPKRVWSPWSRRRRD